MPFPARWLPTLASLALVPALLPRGARGEDYFAPLRAGTVTDERITELSGMVPVTMHEGHYWIHNDSGGLPRIFAMRLDGAIIAEVAVTGATATDWEDIATGPGPAPGDTCLYIGDFGNNGTSREDLAIFRIPEPLLADLAPGQLLASAPAEKLPIRYPDGNFDAEALVVHPASGLVYVLTKASSGAAVYRLPSLDPAAGEQTLTRLGALAYGGLVTGADLSADGSRLLVRTYSHVLEQRLPAGQPFERIFFQRFTSRAGAAAETKSESICYDHHDRDLITSNESIPAPIHRFYLKVPHPLCPVSTPDDPAHRFVRGDVLLELGEPAGDVDVADAAAVAAAAWGLSAPDCPDAVDVDDDGTVSPADAATLLDALVSGTPLVQPFPAQGLDLTADELGCREAGRHPYAGESSMWSYWHAAEPPPADWKEPGADVSRWPQGSGGIGFGAAALETPLAGAPSASLSLLARTELLAGGVEDIAGLDDLLLEIDYNDGFVAYLNGVEVARRGLGDPGFEVPPEQAAAAHAGGVLEEIRIRPELLRPGLNVLALDVRNRVRLDRTLFFRAGLRGSWTLDAPPSPAPAPEPAGALRLEVDGSLPIGEVGAVRVVASSAEALRGASYTLAFDPAVLSVVGVGAPLELEDRVLEAATVDAQAGRLHHALAVRPEALASEGLAPGDEILLAEVIFRPVARTAQTTRIAFVAPTASPRVESLLVWPGPRAAVPEIAGLDVAVTADSGPLIDIVLENDGGNGTVFLVTGRRLVADGLQVKVCGRPAAFEMVPAGGALRVTAPACEREGFAPLEVCTAYGCDTLEEGFRYTEAGPFWIRGDANADGSVDISDAVAILADLFLGIDVRPACSAALDANADGRPDVSDAVFILGFLFQGGVTIALPFPAPGLCP